MSDRELDLALKLLESLHLSVAERAELPNGRMPFSALVRAARRALASSAWLPALQRPAEPFTGVLIEARDTTFWVHEQHEVGVDRLSPVQSRPVRNLAEAVRLRVSDVADPDLDGVPIDWDL